MKKNLNIAFFLLVSAFVEPSGMKSTNPVYLQSQRHQALHDKVAIKIDNICVNFDKRHPLIAQIATGQNTQKEHIAQEKKITLTAPTSSTARTSSSPKKPEYKDVWPADMPWSEKEISDLAQLQKLFAKKSHIGDID